MSLILYKQVDQPIQNDEHNGLVLKKNQQIILKHPGSKSVVVYNKHLEELTIYHHDPESMSGESQLETVEDDSEQFQSSNPEKRLSIDASPSYCLTCGREYFNEEPKFSKSDSNLSIYDDHAESYMDENYFKLLNKGLLGPNITNHESIPSKLFTQGYYKAFFQELALIGIGARGSVFKVRHVLLQSLNLGVYALKKIPIGDDLNMLTKSLEEVKLLNKITSSHPNLIGYNHVWLEMDKSNGIITQGSSDFLIPCVFILQQYCPGGNLEECLINQVWMLNQGFESSDIKKLKHKLRKQHQKSEIKYNSLTNEQIISILKDIANGLSKLHELGIIHRDLKPSNCLLNSVYMGPDKPFPQVVIGDFGESQFNGQLRARTGCTGTMEFTAPEVLITSRKPEKVQEFSFKSDMYSLGMICYFLIFKKLPWGTYDRLEDLKNMVQIKKFTYMDFLKLEKSETYINPKLFELLESLLSNNPNERLSANDVITFLDTIDTMKDEEIVPDTDSNYVLKPLMIAPKSHISNGILESNNILMFCNFIVGLLFIGGYFSKCPQATNYILFLISGILWSRKKQRNILIMWLSYVVVVYIM